jgi:hypothetical protein
MEKETRTPTTILAYGPYLTPKRAKELGVKWAGSVADSLGGSDQAYHPSLFQGMWDDDENDEQEEAEELSPAALFKRLLDIFTRLFTR